MPLKLNKVFKRNAVFLMFTFYGTATTKTSQTDMENIKKDTVKSLCIMYDVM